MKTLTALIFTAAGFSSPAFACGSTADMVDALIQGDRTAVELLAEGCETRLEAHGNGATILMDTRSARGSTRLHSLLRDGTLEILNRGGDATFFVGSCPPGTSHAPVIHTGDRLHLAVLRCR